MALPLTACRLLHCLPLTALTARTRVLSDLSVPHYHHELVKDALEVSNPLDLTVTSSHGMQVHAPPKHGATTIHALHRTAVSGYHHSMSDIHCAWAYAAHGTVACV